jgi:hypothetical protein
MREKSMSMQGKRAGRGAVVSAVVGILIAAMMALVAGGPQATAAQASAAKPVLSSEFGKAKSHVDGTFGNGGTVTGTFTPRRFFVENDQLMAVGKLRATLTRASGKVVGTTAERVTLPVMTPAAEGTAARAAASCDILNLVLGPLDLNLLGLEVHLDTVVLDIVATPGPGNLLGNLLCAVAGLLDGGLAGLLDEVSQILNSILAILRL